MTSITSSCPMTARAISARTAAKVSWKSRIAAAAGVRAHGAASRRGVAGVRAADDGRERRGHRHAMGGLLRTLPAPPARGCDRRRRRGRSSTAPWPRRGCVRTRAAIASSKRSRPPPPRPAARRRVAGSMPSPAPGRRRRAPPLVAGGRSHGVAVGVRAGCHRSRRSPRPRRAVRPRARRPRARRPGVPPGAGCGAGVAGLPVVRRRRGRREASPGRHGGRVGEGAGRLRIRPARGLVARRRLLAPRRHQQPIRVVGCSSVRTKSTRRSPATDAAAPGRASVPAPRPVPRSPTARARARSPDAGTTSGTTSSGRQRVRVSSLWREQQVEQVAPARPSSSSATAPGRAGRARSSTHGRRGGPAEPRPPRPPCEMDRRARRHQQRDAAHRGEPERAATHRGQHHTRRGQGPDGHPRGQRVLRQLEIPSPPHGLHLVPEHRGRGLGNAHALPSNTGHRPGSTRPPGGDPPCAIVLSAGPC